MNKEDKRSDRVIRGGGWFNLDRYVSLVYRFKCMPYSYNNYLGFRLVRTLRTDKQVNKWREESEEELFGD